MKQLLSDFFNSGTERQQNKKRLGALLICATAILLVIALVTLMIASIATAMKNRAPSEDEENTGGTKIPNGYTTTTFDSAQLSTGNLLLIDASHPYAGAKPTTVLFDTHETRAKTTDGEIVYSIGGRYDLAATEETIIAFNTMMNAFYAESGDDALYIAAAYNQNAANQIAGFGYELGTVLSLKYYVNYSESTSNIQTIYGVEKYNWIYENAATYGFIQVSTAEGEENIFRYVGAPHATYMKAQNKTFSEYLTILQARTYRAPLSISVKKPDGESVGYNVYYLTATEELVVPTKQNYTVSGDNMGGYIITVDKTTKTN